MRRAWLCLWIGCGLACSDAESPPNNASGLTAGTASVAAGIGGAAGVTLAGTGVVAGTNAMPDPTMQDAGPQDSGAAPTAGTGAQAGMVAAGTGAVAGQGGLPDAQVPEAGNGAAGTTGGAEPAQACQASQTGTPGRETVRLQHAGVSREYILYVPSSYSGDEPVPLVVYFHPLLTNSRTAETSSGFKELADREGFIVAFPEGQQSAAWNVGVCCTASRDVDDVGFARALVEQVKGEYCVDNKRVYASGFSMGGGMSHYLACEAADVFAAVAPGAFDLFEENDCTPARPITVISFRGTSDVIVPYEGGRKTSAPNGFVGVHTFEGAEGTFDHWAEINGCTGEATDEGGGCKTHSTCTDGVEVTLCTSSGGHEWPDPDRAWSTLERFSLP